MVGFPHSLFVYKASMLASGIIFHLIAGQERCQCHVGGLSSFSAPYLIEFRWFGSHPRCCSFVRSAIFATAKMARPEQKVRVHIMEVWWRNLEGIEDSYG